MEEKKCTRCGELLPLSWQEYAYQKWGESEIAC